VDEGRVKLTEARPIALQLVERLRPHCERCEIAGSVRRGKPEVGDIEIVCIPRTEPRDGCFSFADFGETCRSQDFIRAAYQIGDIVKGHPIDGKYIQFAHPAGIQVDLFTAHRDNWGLIYAIRTGSADFSQRVLAWGWCRAGYHSVAGMLVRDDAKFPVREEADLFALIGIPWVAPGDRT
jgi:DNA polymerase/3'-5' exonuclease PolX